MTTANLKTQVFPLPSKGKPYNNLNLVNGDSLTIRPWVAGDQRHFAVSNDLYASYSTFLNRLVSEPKPLDIDQLLLDDVNAVLFGVRILSFGPDYSMPFLCQSCNQVSTQTISLDTVNVTNADEVEGGFQAQDLEIELESGKITVHLKTLGDEKEINKQLANLRRRGGLINEDLDRQFISVAQAIDTINDKSEVFNVKFEWVQNLSQNDFDNILNLLNNKSIGMSDKVDVHCEKCGFDQEARLVITTAFFHPSSGHSR